MNTPPVEVTVIDGAAFAQIIPTGESKTFADYANNIVIISTLSNRVIYSKNYQNTEGLQPCSHEEADTRILLHVKDAMNCGLSLVKIKTVDTDVVILAVAHFQDYQILSNFG